MELCAPHKGAETSGAGRRQGSPSRGEAGHEYPRQHLCAKLVTSLQEMERFFPHLEPLNSNLDSTDREINSSLVQNGHKQPLSWSFSDS